MRCTNMCLAVIGKVMRLEETQAKVKVEGNLVNINIQLTPTVCAGQHVLVHAGFAIAVVAEDEATETQALLDQIAGVLDDVK
ncbi:MAG: hydrogenase assembly chaperone hypC/hupF [Firmicutes bacterium]|nr:hydrogenase assembly chaperone hypC/hupF [Bacillota bacterium]